jgi:DNA-directed RNA polymerase specialized sigma subunit
MPDRPHRSDALAHVVPADLDAIEAPEVDVGEIESMARLHAAIARLPERLRVVLVARLDGATLREAGALVGVGAQRAMQMERQAACELRAPRYGLARMVEVEEVDWRGRTWRVSRAVPA